MILYVGAPFAIASLERTEEENASSFAICSSSIVGYLLLHFIILQDLSLDMLS